MNKLFLLVLIFLSGCTFKDFTDIMVNPTITNDKPIIITEITTSYAGQKVTQTAIYEGKSVNNTGTTIIDINK